MSATLPSDGAAAAAPPAASGTADVRDIYTYPGNEGLDNASGAAAAAGAVALNAPAAPVVALVHKAGQEAAREDVIPHLTATEHDDLYTKLPHDASAWTRFKHSPVTKRVGRVVIILAVGAVVLLILNFALAPRAMKCGRPSDCRRIARMNTMLSAVRGLLNLVIAFLLLFLVLAACGVNTKALLATAGLVGIIVGLGAQAAIKSCIAGLTYVLNDRFAIGDFVAVELVDSPSVRGLVTGFSLMTTTLQDFGGGRHYVSNGLISVVTNYSQNDQRSQVDVTVSYDGRIDDVLKEVQALADDMATDPELRHRVVRPPVVKGVTANGERSYTVSVAAIVRPNARAFVDRHMRLRLLRLMQALRLDASAEVTHVHARHNDALQPLQRDLESGSADTPAVSPPAVEYAPAPQSAWASSVVTDDATDAAARGATARPPTHFTLGNGFMGTASSPEDFE